MFSHRVLCETVKSFITKVGRESKDEDEVESISEKCGVLNQKLDALLTTLDMEEQAARSLSDAQSVSSNEAGHSTPVSIRAGEGGGGGGFNELIIFLCFFICRA